MAFSSKQTTIVGLGLMGASLALALRPYVGTLVAVETDVSAREEALRRGLVDQATDDLREGVRYADVVLLCAPVRVVLQLVRDRIGSYLRSNTLLMDIGSTKQDICEALGRLPIGIQAIGGHPMTGKEISGLSAADADLYKGKPWVLCETRRTTPATRIRALELLEVLQAVPVEMDALRHDKVVAAISHLPYLLSASLVATVQYAARSTPEVWDLAAGGFRDTSRLAGSDITMNLDILSTNTQAVATLLAMFRVQLGMLETMLISHDEKELNTSLTGIREARRTWFSDYERRSNGHLR
jgi:prephenate dehydrogenase